MPRALTFRPRRITALALVLIAGLLGACTVNPATGKSDFTLFMSPEKERQVGAQEHPKILRAFDNAYDDAALDAYVTELGNKLVAVSETPTDRFTFTVLNSSVVNAFALPGGYVYVTRGLLALASSEAELAGVLAHEIGHVVARHSAQRYSQGVVTQILAAGADAAIRAATGTAEAGNLIGLGAAVYLRSFSREHEYEADLLGIRYLARAGYDTGAMAGFLRKMRRNAGLQARLAGLPEGSVDKFDIMSTHPRTVDRVERAAAQASIAPNHGGRAGQVDYLRAIDGLVYGGAEAQGYIRGRVFAHVPLDFRFEVPDGFRMTNSPENVTARGPQDAAIVFEAAAAATGLDPVDYLRYGFSKQLQLKEVGALTINGLRAATGATRIRLPRGGVRDLRVVAVRMDAKTTYQMLFLSRPETTAEFETPFRRTTYSFRRLTAEEKQALTARRIRIRAVNEGYDLATFLDDMAVNDDPAEIFALLNGIDKGTLPPVGTPVKVVR